MFTSLAFLKRSRFLIEEGHHKNHTLLAVEEGAFEMDGICLQRGSVAWLPKTYVFSRRITEPLTLLFAETDRVLSLKPGVQESDPQRVCEDIKLLRGHSVYEPFTAHLLNDIVWCCTKPRRDYEPLVREAIEIFLQSGLRAGTELICKRICISQAWLISRFKASTGKTPGRFFAQLRLEKAKGLLADTGENISAIAEECGFESASYFSNFFLAAEGRSPRDFRKSFEV